MKTTLKYNVLVVVIIITCLFLIITCLFLVTYNASAQTKTANFAGQWHLNEDKSDFGRLTAASLKKSQVLTISQTTDEIDIKSGDSTENNTSVIRLDGKQSQLITNQIISEIPNIIKSELSTHWTNDHVVIVTMDHPKNALPPSVKTYTISPDGQTLSIDYRLKYSNEDLVLKLIYDKQKGN
ncbi:MAG: hypothetical protein AAGC65_16520 [Mucilaginibacter sp.]|uniref:hypothetical protein n=1 Tax=Mucilaginibacter sp. TaxID=1882438 RepID=UPI0031A16C56